MRKLLQMKLVEERHKKQSGTFRTFRESTCQRRYRAAIAKTPRAQRAPRAMSVRFASGTELDFSGYLGS